VRGQHATNDRSRGEATRRVDERADGTRMEKARVLTRLDTPRHADLDATRFSMLYLDAAPLLKVAVSCAKS